MTRIWGALIRSLTRVLGVRGLLLFGLLAMALFLLLRQVRTVRYRFNEQYPRKWGKMAKSYLEEERRKVE